VEGLSKVNTSVSVRIACSRLSDPQITGFPHTIRYAAADQVELCVGQDPPRLREAKPRKVRTGQRLIPEENARHSPIRNRGKSRPASTRQTAWRTMRTAATTQRCIDLYPELPIRRICAGSPENVLRGPTLHPEKPCVTAALFGRVSSVRIRSNHAVLHVQLSVKAHLRYLLFRSAFRTSLALHRTDIPWAAQTAHNYADALLEWGGEPLPSDCGLDAPGGNWIATMGELRDYWDMFAVEAALPTSRSTLNNERTVVARART